jgi:IclR family KDG regulon transcriptional repressor
MKSIIKALDILEKFQTHNTLGITRLAELTNLSVPTTYRITRILVTKGYIRQTKKGGKYCLGSKLFGFLSAYKDTIKIGEIALPFLESISQSVGESINLAIPDGNQAIYIENIAATHQLQIFTRTGNRVPLYCTGIGKVFLAYLPDRKVEELIGNNMNSRTFKTITDINILKKDLVKVKEKGLAVDDEENELGVRCIAAPIKDSYDDVIAAVSISVPTVRLSIKKLISMGPLLKDCALQISREFGYCKE